MLQQQPQQRRRRPRPRSSPTSASKATNPSTLIVSCLVLVLLVTVQTASARSFLDPVAVGLRSALASRTTASGSTKSSQTTTRLVSSQEEGFLEDAFFRASSVEDVERIKAVSYAFRPKQQRVVSVDEENDELEYMESCAVPCAARSSVKAIPVSTAAQSTLVSTTSTDATSRGGAATALRSLLFWESMVCGAVSRSIAQTVMHPANTMKTILQSSRGSTGPTIASLMKPESFQRLTQGAGANFILSVPHGAINFAVLELVRRKLAVAVEETPFLKERADSMSASLDFLSSAISTITCSIVSTPQMMITDNIMAGNYPNLPTAISGLAKSQGIGGFYSGWWPGLVGKIPSYALTWTIFQQLKEARNKWSDRPSNNIENSIMGCVAAGTTVCIMIPMDTIKTRLVTQGASKGVEGAYKGIIDCAIRVAKEEGVATFYRGLPPRLVSVVPMIGIQFGVYEAMKKVMLKRDTVPVVKPKKPVQLDSYGSLQILQEAAMEVAASPEHPYPAPQFVERARNGFKNRMAKMPKTTAN